MNVEPSVAEPSPQLPPTVPCTRCSRPIPAHLSATQCLTCQLLAAPVIPVPSDTRVKQPVWPWLAALGAVAVAATISVIVYVRHERRARLEHEYPVASSSGDAMILAKEGKAWAKGRAKLLAALARVDIKQIESRITDAPCHIPFDPPTDAQVDAANVDESRAPGSFSELISSVRDPDRAAAADLEDGPELVANAKEKLDAIVATSDRKRFRTAAIRDQVVAAVDDPALLVYHFDVDERPELVPPEGFKGGRREGIAYAFDRESGELRCAGRFAARSSEQVQALTNMMGFGNEHEALDRDLDAQTERAIATALRETR